MKYNDKKLEYSAEWRGPLKDRSCTDWPCLFIFVIFIASWFGVGYYALIYGDIKTLLAPVDSHGRKCGIDNDVVNDTYLVFFDITTCVSTKRKCDTPQVCRQQCPSNNWSWEFWDVQSESYIKRNIICETGIDVDTKTKTELRALVQENKCIKWYLTSSSVVGRCIPNDIPKDLLNVTLPEGILDHLEDARKIVKAFVVGLELIDTAIATSKIVVGMIGGCAMICLIYMFLLRWLAFPFVFGAAAILTAFSSYIAYYFYERYTRENEKTWLALTIVFGIIAAIIVLIVLCLLKRIRLACQLIQEASKAVCSILSSLFFPICPWLLHLGAIAYSLIVGGYLYSIKIEEQWILMTIHVVGFIWLYFFISALGEMILAATFATWYWTMKKSDVPFFTLTVSAWRTIRYHLGTLAFGALLVTICRLARILLEIVSSAAKKEGGIFYHLCLRWFIACARCMLKLLEKLVKFMNRNAYIMCAVYGKGLCSSASMALSLIMRNALRVLVLTNVVSWLLWLGKLGNTILMGGAAWFFYTNTKYEIENWYVPVVLVVIGSYLVANVFFNVYEVAVNTMFLCFLEDCERNDGTQSKPYYMSNSLRQLMLKN